MRQKAIRNNARLRDVRKSGLSSARRACVATTGDADVAHGRHLAIRTLEEVRDAGLTTRIVENAGASRSHQCGHVPLIVNGCQDAHPLSPPVYLGANLVEWRAQGA